MTLEELISFLRIKDVTSVLLFMVPVVLSLIQVAPVKINPWDGILRWFGKKVNGELSGKVDRLEKRVEDVCRESEKRALADMRWHILNFAYTCRSGEEHTKEQWNHVLDQCKEYEAYVEQRMINNGVIEEDTKYIRELYNRLSKEGRIK